MEQTRATEAKDLPVPLGATRDLGAELGNRRIAYIGAAATWFALAACLVLGVALASQLLRNQYVPIPVEQSGHRVLAVSGDFAIADSILYQPEQLIEVAKDYLDLRYAYDYRAGPAKLVAAAQMIERGYAEGAINVPADLIQRLNAQMTRVTLSVDSSGVRPVSRGIFEVTVKGTRSLENVQYFGSNNARQTPYKQVVTLRVVGAGPKFPRGVAVRGAKGDLEP